MKYVIIPLLIFLFGFYEARNALEDTFRSDNFYYWSSPVIRSTFDSYSRNNLIIAVFPAGAAVLAGGSVVKGIVDGIFGSSSSKRNLQAQREANATNLQINRENNAANLSLAREQNQWNLDQWNRENAYNDPSAQMGRYTSAGINPYMAMSQLTNGNTSSSLQSANLANQTPASVSPVLGSDPSSQFFQNGLTGAIDSFMSLYSAFQDSQLKQNEIDKGTTELGWLDKKLRQEYNQRDLDISASHFRNIGMYYDNFGKKAMADYYNAPGFVDRKIGIENMSLAQMEQALRVSGKQIELMDAQQKLLDLDIKFNGVRNQFAERNFIADLTTKYATINRMNVQNFVDYYNAKTGRMNAITLQKEANTHAFEAQTHRMSAVTDRMRLFQDVKESNQRIENLVNQNITEDSRRHGLDLDNESKDRTNSFMAQTFLQRMDATWAELDYQTNHFKNMSKKEQYNARVLFTQWSCEQLGTAASAAAPLIPLLVP